ncbi:L-threonylcarbamoyladenylate synthase [Leptobacterium sp. I13]|uniref:L-threonylcarbamoyladenylate synthase n=1 Tax=Leptobacterium meishanense TaxID=3128904 RepID=UPI0030EF8579
MHTITQNINNAIQFLKKGKLVAIPTETVYGLAANGTDEHAIKKIFTAKNRPTNNPLILHFASLEAVLPYVAEFPEQALKLAKAFWPGPLTLLLPKSDNVPESITAGSLRVAVRVPDHPVTQKLLSQLDFPLAAPSANPSGYISPTLPEHVEKQLGDKVAMILDGGPCNQGIESTILGWDTSEKPVIYRQGTITPQDIENVLGRWPKIVAKKQKKIETPGMLSTHYAPKTPTLITNNIEASVKRHPQKMLGVITLMPHKQLPNTAKQTYLSKSGDLTEVAKNLYYTMHIMDAQNLELIIIERAPNEGVGMAINDRLERAASYKEDNL